MKVKTIAELAEQYYAIFRMSSKGRFNSIILIICGLLINGCAINYKPANLQPVKSSNLVNDANSTSIQLHKKDDTTYLFNNARIKKQLFKKGYTSYTVAIVNNTPDTLEITS